MVGSFVSFLLVLLQLAWQLECILGGGDIVLVILDMFTC